MLDLNKTTSKLAKVGLHVSISGSIDKAVDRANERGCDTFQLFTRNPRAWKYRELKPPEIEDFMRKTDSFEMWPIFAHMPYLTNLASPIDSVYSKSVDSLKVELKRCEMLGVPYVVTHLGSHLGVGYEEGRMRIVTAVDEAFSAVENDVVILLEISAGTRNSMGSSFREIQEIIEGIEDEDRVGFCFDTSHGFAAGYDLRDLNKVEKTIDELDESIGFHKLKLLHINDSKGDLGSGIDRHEHIGLGRIGGDGFVNIFRSRFGEVPLILETPIDGRRSDFDNLAKVRDLYRIAREI